MRSQFAAFVRKESLHILRDKRTMLIVFMIPVVLTVLFGFAISTEVNNVNVSVSAPDITDGVRDAVRDLDANPYFTFVGYVRQDGIDDVLRSGRADAAIVFSRDYDRRQMLNYQGVDTGPGIQVILDASNVNKAQAATAYLGRILSGKAGQQDIFETRLLFNPQMKSSYNFVPGILGLIFILVCALMTSVSIVREKERGTMEVLLVSPVKPMRIILAKMVPYFVISAAVLAVVLLLAHFLLGVPMSSGVGGIIVISLVYVALSLCLGLLISTLVTTQLAALLLSAMVMMFPILMLSGMIFPIENLPGFFRGLSCIVPARWYIDAIRKMMIQGLPLASVAGDLAVLSGMASFIMLVALKKFNDRLE